MIKTSINIWILILLIGILNSCTLKLKTIHKPNVIIVLTDDQGWGDVGFNGNKMINTPTLDSLSRVGVVINRFYSSPACATARASILTGKYFVQNQVKIGTKHQLVLPESEITIGEVLKDNGYSTAYFGKWNNGIKFPYTPLGQGFDKFFGFTGEYLHNYFNSKLQYNGNKVTSQGYITDVLTDSVVNYIETADQPFLAFVAYNTPHTPYQVPDKYYNRYIKKGLDKKTATIYGMCENIDDNILRIQNTLKKSQKLDNTIFIYLSDNGSNFVRYNGGLKGRKNQVDEGGVRVSFIFNYPNSKTKPKMVRNGFGAHIDILPTILDLCSIEEDDLKFDGISLKDVLTTENQNIEDREFFIHQIVSNFKNTGSVRTNDYLLTFYPHDTALYNLKKDPCQITNIILNDPLIGDSLIIGYNDWLEETASNELSYEPIQIGYNSFTEVELLANESNIASNLSFANGKDYANDWVKNWNDTNDYIKWPLNILEAGKYKIKLKYVCNKESLGNKFKLICQENFINFIIQSEHKKQIIQNPDRIKRDEEYEISWGDQLIGEIELNRGVCSIDLIYNSTNKSNIEIKGLEILSSN